MLVTGGAGFIGSNFIHYLLHQYEDISVINFDKLTYAGNLENLREIDADPRYQLYRGDIADPRAVRNVFARGIDVVVNFAAESHNDRGVLDPAIFLQTNVLGTQVLLDAAREFGVSRFHHISTCEVFGDLALDEDRAFRENDGFSPRTPYNASKASANHVAMAYYHTYGIPVTISHCANNYGRFQFPEKLIPLFVTNALEGKSLPVFRSSQNRREWIHVLDHCRGIDRILQKGTVGEAYNIGTGIEKSVEEITDIILETLNRPATLKQYVPDRLGHDRRYVLDSSKIRSELGWEPTVDFEQGIRETIEWYVTHPEWWQRIKAGVYQDYYDRYYGEKLGKA